MYPPPTEQLLVVVGSIVSATVRADDADAETVTELFVNACGVVIAGKVIV